MASNFTIIKGAELPRRHGITYPFGEMEVGDCFDAPPEYKARIRAAACAFGKDHGKKFAVRAHSKGFRCWRVA